MRIKFIQKIIDKIRNKKQREIKCLSQYNNIEINKLIVNNVNLNIKGQNNTIIINTSLIKGTLNINIFGNDNYIYIDNNVTVSQNLSILIGQNHHNFGKVNNSRFEIYKNTSVESVNYITFNSNTFCKIQEDCMLSYGITIYNTDAHPIFIKGTRTIINKVKGIKIGKHSWIGMNVTILKNSNIPSNSIIGCNTVFCGGGGGLTLRICRKPCKNC